MKHGNLQGSHQQQVPVLGSKRSPRFAARQREAKVLQALVESQEERRQPVTARTHPLKRHQSPVYLRPRVVPPVLQPNRLRSVRRRQQPGRQRQQLGTMIRRRAGTADAVVADDTALSYLQVSMSWSNTNGGGRKCECDNDETCHFKASA